MTGEYDLDIELLSSETLDMEAIEMERWAAVYMKLPSNPSPDFIGSVHRVAEHCYWSAQFRVDNPGWPDYDHYEPDPGHEPYSPRLPEHAKAALARMEECEKLDPELKRLGYDEYVYQIVAGIRPGPDSNYHIGRTDYEVQGSSPDLTDRDPLRGDVQEEKSHEQGLSPEKPDQAIEIDPAGERRYGELDAAEYDARSKQAPDGPKTSKYDVIELTDAQIARIERMSGGESGGHERSDERNGDDLDRQHENPGGRGRNR